jgi:hypothetical protein
LAFGFFASPCNLEAEILKPIDVALALDAAFAISVVSISPCLVKACAASRSNANMLEVDRPDIYVE